MTNVATRLLLASVVICGCPAKPDNPGSDAGPDGSDAAVDGGDDGGGDGGVDGGGGLAVTSVLPSRGPLAGGTAVTVTGRGFEEGASATFGGEAAAGVEVRSATELTCQTPPAVAPGPVDVVVALGDGQSASLAAAFSYDVPPPTAIDRCRLEGPSTITVEAGAATEVITGLVFVDGATAAEGQAAGLTGEVGFGPDGSEPGAGWTWIRMTYSGDEGDEDRYGGRLLAPPEGEHDYAVRFSADGGESWTACDLDGSDGGYSADEAGALTVTAPPAGQVDWCGLVHPSSTTTAPGAATETIYGQVYEPGVTDTVGLGLGVRAQLGYGPDGSSPPGGEWHWQDASFQGDVGSNDEYQASLTIESPGSYDYAYRFSLDEGESWVYCDLDGSESGYDAAQAGSLTIEVPTDPQVDWCTVQWPEGTSTVPGTPSAAIYGQVFEPGVTDGAGAGSPMAAQLGYGPDGEAPEGSSAWRWVDATYNVDFGYNDEYMATLTVADEGSYDYAYRFSLDGSSWLYCDLDGSTDGYDPADTGWLVVAPAGPTLPDWCGLWWPSATSTVEGVSTEPIYGQVFVAGVTDAEGQGSGVLAEVGYGPDGEAPEGSDGWTWAAAEYNVDYWANDEYMATITPASPGAYDYGYRFSLDGGSSWLYCDTDGSSNGFDPALSGELTVAEAVLVDWCAIQHPLTLTVTASEESDPIYGRVFEPGVTDSVGEGSGLRGQVGFGPDGSDPAAGGWSWSDTVFNVDDGASNDEHVGTVTPLAAGTYDFAYRFSLDDGASWVYCDGGEGSTDGYAPSDAGQMTVAE